MSSSESTSTRAPAAPNRPSYELQGRRIDLCWSPGGRKSTDCTAANQQQDGAGRRSGSTAAPQRRSTPARVLTPRRRASWILGVDADVPQPWLLPDPGIDADVL
jgi:hypothetical protein